MRQKPLIRSKGLFLLLSLCLVFVLGVRLGDKSVQILQEKSAQGEVQGITTSQEPQDQEQLPVNQLNPQR